jgi:hypothetical protein
LEFCLAFYEKAAEAALHSTAHIIKNSNTHDIKACDKKQVFLPKQFPVIRITGKNG